MRGHDVRNHIPLQPMLWNDSALTSIDSCFKIRQYNMVPQMQTNDISTPLYPIISHHLGFPPIKTPSTSFRSNYEDLVLFSNLGFRFYAPGHRMCPCTPQIQDVTNLKKGSSRLTKVSRTVTSYHLGGRCAELSMP